MAEFIDGKRYTGYIIDPSAASFKAELRMRALKVKEADDLINADNEVLNGIRLTANLFQSKKLLVNKEKCPNLRRELASYILEFKSIGARGRTAR